MSRKRRRRNGAGNIENEPVCNPLGNALGVVLGVSLFGHPLRQAAAAQA
jgi:hypothetical protein